MMTSASDAFTCGKCRDEGRVFWKTVDGWRSRECVCALRKKYFQYARENGFELEHDLPNVEVKTVRDYKARADSSRRARALVSDYLRRYDEIAKSKNNCLLLLGNKGAGKTHLLMAIARALILKEPSPVKVMVRDAARMIDGLKNFEVGPARLEATKDAYCVAEILIVDEFLKKTFEGGNTSGWESEQVHTIFNQRYRLGLPTIVSSQMLPGEFQSALGSVYDRLAERAFAEIVFVDEADNYRPVIAREGPKTAR